MEARAFDVYNRVSKRLFGGKETVRSFVDPGHKTGTGGNAHSRSTAAMTGTTKGD
jgi:hypothetical protein